MQRQHPVDFLQRQTSVRLCRPCMWVQTASPAAKLADLQQIGVFVIITCKMPCNALTALSALSIPQPAQQTTFASKSQRLPGTWWSSVHNSSQICSIVTDERHATGGATGPQHANLCRSCSHLCNGSTAIRVLTAQSSRSWCKGLKPMPPMTSHCLGLAFGLLVQRAWDTSFHLELVLQARACWGSGMSAGRAIGITFFPCRSSCMIAQSFLQQATHHTGVLLEDALFQENLKQAPPSTVPSMLALDIG